MTRLADVTPADVEQFLYADAALLDAWKLDEWLGHLADDVSYEVPATDLPNANLATDLALIGDDLSRIRSRVRHLRGGSVLGEDPPSRTRRLVTNVRIVARRDDAIDVAANFAIYRFKHELSEVFVGHYEHELVLVGGALKFRKRRAVLDMETLRPHGKLTILL